MLHRSWPSVTEDRGSTGPSAMPRASDRATLTFEAEGIGETKRLILCRHNFAKVLIWAGLLVGLYPQRLLHEKPNRDATGYSQINSVGAAVQDLKGFS